MSEGKILNAFQHVLHRPDAYIGSIKTVVEDHYVLRNDKVEYDSVTYNRGIINIIREIGSNSIDNGWRSKEVGIPMTCIKITWDTKGKSLTFWNDGKFIPVEKRSYIREDYRKKTKIEETMYPAEAFFGEMLAGTNFEDDIVRKTSGRNGMGSKITNAFSTIFTVKQTDSDAGKQFFQIYTNNGKEHTEPEITAFKLKKAFTEVSFVPDYERFGYDINHYEVEKQFIELLGMYALEIAAVTSVPVHFDWGESKGVYHLKTFEKYVRKFYPSTSDNKLSVIILQNGDECVIVENYSDESPDTLEDVRHTSFVNGIRTKDGGVHVAVWRDAIVPAFVRHFNARKPKKGETPLKTTAKEVYPYLTFFLRTEMDKPSFDQQVKDRLNGPEYFLYPQGKNKADKEEQARIKTEIENVVVKMIKWNFVKALEEKLLSKGNVHKTKKATKTKGRINFGKKTQDANDAGKFSEDCTLYIVEGLSAKAMVSRGISSLERGTDRNGIAAIQGKILNVSNSTTEQLHKNYEIEVIMKMMNLVFGVNYSTPEAMKTLRYHRVRLATDMDDDGIHIRGLVLNLFYTWWPELFKEELKMLGSLSTGVARVLFPGKKDIKMFFSNPEYKLWYETKGVHMKIAEVKYLKGLASNNPDDTPKYFSDPKIVYYYLEGNESEYMKLGFNDDKKHRNDRKEWILRDIKPDKYTQKFFKVEYKDENNIEHDVNYVYDGKLGLSTFVNKQLIIYHKAASPRALQHIMDGFKDGQRRIFYTIRAKNYKKTVNLEKVAGAVGEMAGYHHGAASLVGTIKCMAARFPGGNNIALFEADGEFGTRFTGNGDDAGAGRYIHTGLEKLSKAIFLPIDDNILTPLIEDDVMAGYEFLVPVICMILINGAEGIATGFSSSIPNYNPDDVLKWTRLWLDGDTSSMPPLVPWYRGIEGPITLENFSKDGVPTRWRTKGILKECGKGCKIMVSNKKCDGKPGWWHITDAPVALWTAKLKEYIEYIYTGNPIDNKSWKKLDKPYIKDYSDHCSPNKVHFMIKPSDDWEPDLDTTLKKLNKIRHLTNMYTIDDNNYARKHETAESILEEWCHRRLFFYEKRYDYILDMHNEELTRVQNKYMFVKAVVDKKLDMYQEDALLEEAMLNMGLQKLKDDISKKKVSEEGDEEKSEDEGLSFTYLLRMQMRSMTVKKVAELQSDIDKIKRNIEVHKSKTPKDLWRVDLDNFEVAYKQYLKENPMK